MGAGIRRAFDVAAAVAVVACITALVRPGSKGPALVTAIGNAFVMASAGTVGATITPDAQIPGAPGGPPADTGTALGTGVGAARAGGTGAGPTGGYVPDLYNIPGDQGDRRVRYW